MKPIALCQGVACSLLFATWSGAAEPARPVRFETDIRPILKAHCFECHGEGKKLRAGLDLRLKHTMLKGGDTSAAIVSGKSAESLLVQRIRSGEMPPSKVKLTKEQLGLIERWIAEGATTTRPEPKQLPLGFSISPEESSFWAFQPIRRSETPKVNHAQLARTPIDAFLLAKLENQGQTFSPEADATTLLRRVHFDLIGLPPGPAEVAAFLRESVGDRRHAYDRVVDRLLNSPPVRRALGPALARCRGLRRFRRLHRRRSGAQLGVEVPRLRDSGVQCRQTIRRIHPGTARRRRDGAPTV